MSKREKKGKLYIANYLHRSLALAIYERYHKLISDLIH